MTDPRSVPPASLALPLPSGSAGAVRPLGGRRRGASVAAAPAPAPAATRDAAEPGDVTPTGIGHEAFEERALVLAAKDGDEGAFAGLVRRHQRRAYAVARSILLTHADAEDAVQDGFLHAWRALDRFRPEQAFGAWLHRIVANASLDLARRRKVRAADQLPETLATSPRDPAVRAEIRGRLGEALATLPERQRAVLVLHDVEGYKHAEIGGMLGIPDGTSRSDLHHARAALRRELGNLRTSS